MEGNKGQGKEGRDEGTGANISSEMSDYSVT